MQNNIIVTLVKTFILYFLLAACVYNDLIKSYQEIGILKEVKKVNDNNQVNNLCLQIARAEAYNCLLVVMVTIVVVVAVVLLAMINLSRVDIKIEDLPLGSLSSIEFEINKELDLFLNNKVLIQ